MGVETTRSGEMIQEKVNIQTIHNLLINYLITTYK